MINEIKLGLGNPPLPIYLYIKNEKRDNEQYCWYKYLREQDKKIPVYETELTGYINEIRITQKEYEGEDTLKLDIVVSADEIYVIRSGINTNFAKSFLLTASLIEDFSQPLIIAVNPGKKNTVFCSIKDAQTRFKFKRDWDNNADWDELIKGLQLKLSSNPKFELDEQEIAPITQPQPPQPKSATVHSQDLRIKQIRTLTNYPVDLIKEWLQFQNASAPSELHVSVVDKLVRDICLAWAADKIDPNYAASSYQQQVLGAVANGMDEVRAIQAWMNYVVGQRATVSSR